MAFVQTAAVGELTTAEAAERLGVSSGTIRAAISAGHLAARREPWGTWIVDADDLERYAHERRPRPALRRNPRGLPDTALRILGALAGFDHDSAQQLAQVVGVHPGNARKHLNHMAALTPPLVVPSELGQWSITPAGRRFVERIEGQGFSLAPEPQLAQRALQLVVDGQGTSEEDTTT